MSIIYCNLDLFTYNQVLYKKDFETNTLEEIGIFPLTELERGLIVNCYSNNIFEVKLSGPKDYIEKIIENIGIAETCAYSEKRINIEVV